MSYSLATENYKQDGGLPINTFEADPVYAAIDGPDGINKLFTFQRATRLPIGFATAFMAQRCSKSVNSWDGYCDMYLKQEQDKNFTGKAAHQFIRDTLSRMFCQNDTSIPGSQCIERCEMFDPTTDNSASVCMTQGDLVFRQSEKVSAMDTLYPQTGKLSTTSPIRFTKCPKICNIFDAEKLSDRNVPLNIALDQGIAMDLIENLVENLVAAKKTDMVTNGRLLRFINAYAQDGTVKPGLYNLGAGPYVTNKQIALPAVAPYIPPQETLIVNENRTITGPQMIPASAKPSEPFGFLDLKTKRDNNMLYAILIISVIAVIFLCINKASKKFY